MNQISLQEMGKPNPIHWHKLEKGQIARVVSRCNTKYDGSYVIKTTGIDDQARLVLLENGDFWHYDASIYVEPLPPGTTLTLITG